ncbi:hypothetical protein AB1K54_16295 [Microbacterium sp. BWT-B31]|uniref:hypothetical protein n=1 Tax=Microbacterium sp. BWT-B31 TaxID=3232072 RepID=UPI0035289BDE
MQSVQLETPKGISARLGWDPKMSEHDRKRALAKELVAARLGIEEREITVGREHPTIFGMRTELFAEVDGVTVPVEIRNVNYRAATVVAVAEPEFVFGLDLRDSHPDDVSVHEMQRHSHIFDEENIPKLLEHWTRVCAIREADGRKNLIRGDSVKLDASLAKGWMPDRKLRYSLVDLSREGWIITLAWAPKPEDWAPATE